MNVVSVMAHQDDELNCLGTMLRMKAHGAQLAFICVTDGSGGMVHQPSLSRADAAAIRHKEMTDLCNRVDAEYICLNEQDEYLYDTPAVRNSLIQALRAVQADVVFTHFHDDYNLDHICVNSLVRQCAMQAALPIVQTAAAPLLRMPAIFETEPSGSFGFEPSHWVDISAVIQEKMELSRLHASQDSAFRAAFGYGIDTWILSASRFRGSQALVDHAEAFKPMLVRGAVRSFQVLP